MGDPEAIGKLSEFLRVRYTEQHLARIIHEPDRLWHKAFQPEAVVIYCEG